MSFFSKSLVLHHFKICFPLPVEKVQNCLKKIQNLNRKNTSAVCISFNGHSQSPQSCQLLHQSLINAKEINRLQIFTFLQDKATSLTYYTATSGQKIIANPYSLIGDVGVTQKTYRNIKRLLDFIGLKYTEYGSKNQSSQLWNQFVEKSQKQKEITEKWLSVVQNNMINSVSKLRNLPKQNVLAIKSKLFHPQDALKAKLIDQVSTFEDFTRVNYPNHNVEDYVYKLDGIRLRSTLTQRQISAFTTLFEVASMPNVALFASQDLLQSSIRQIIGLIQERLMNQASMEELDCLLGDLFSRFEESFQLHSNLIF